jgi:hypothetical protein
LSYAPRTDVNPATVPNGKEAIRISEEVASSSDRPCPQFERRMVLECGTPEEPDENSSIEKPCPTLTSASDGIVRILRASK